VNWTRPVVVGCVSSTALTAEEEAFQLSERDALQRCFSSLLFCQTHFDPPLFSAELAVTCCAAPGISLLADKDSKSLLLARGTKIPRCRGMGVPAAPQDDARRPWSFATGALCDVTQRDKAASWFDLGSLCSSDANDIKINRHPYKLLLLTMRLITQPTPFRLTASLSLTSGFFVRLIIAAGADGSRRSSASAM